MRLWAIAERNVRQRFVISMLTVLSIAIGTGLVAFLWMAAEQAEERYQSSSRGFGAILGPKDTSPLGIVLSTVFHTRGGAGVIPISTLKELLGDTELRRRVGPMRHAIPYVYGDNYRGHPIVGTIDAWFDEFSRGEGPDGERLHLELAQGAAWSFDLDDLYAEARTQAEHLRRVDAGGDPGALGVPEAWCKVVLGADVAQKLDLQVGDRIVPTHGFEDSFHEHPEGESEVVGILAPTQSPIDRAIYVPAGLLYRMSGHRAIGQGTENVPDNVEVSAIVLDPIHRTGTFRLRYEFQRRTDAQVALPRLEIADLFRIVGNVTLALRAVSLLVLFTGALAVFISLYQTMFARQRDVAIMRSLGARRLQIFGIVLIEALLISLLGALLGLLLAHGSAAAFSGILLERTGVPLEGFVFSWRDLALLGGVGVLGALAGLLPALRTSMTDVARFLAPDR